MFFEIDRERFKLAVLESVVNAALAFLVLYYVCTLFAFPLVFAAALTALVFAASMHRSMRRFDISSLRKRDPKTEEMLKTAKDNLKETNPVATAFFRDVLGKAKDVSLADLLSLRSFTVRLLAIVVVGVASVMMPPAVLGQQLTLWGPLFPADVGQGIVTDRSDILDNPDLIDLTTQTIQINIQPSSNELDFSTLKDIEEKNFARNPYPTEAEAVSDTPSNEGVPEDFDLIKEYNLAIHQGG